MAENELNDYIRRHMPKPDPFFAVEPLPEYPLVDWDSVPFADESQMMRPSFPRVLPTPTGTREPMAHDGGPGIKDHSVIKSILRKSGLL